MSGFDKANQAALRAERMRAMAQDMQNAANQRRSGQIDGMTETNMIVDAMRKAREYMPDAVYLQDGQLRVGGQAAQQSVAQEATLPGCPTESWLLSGAIKDVIYAAPPAHPNQTVWEIKNAERLVSRELFDDLFTQLTDARAELTALRSRVAERDASLAHAITRGRKTR